MLFLMEKGVRPNIWINFIKKNYENLTRDNLFMVENKPKLNHFCLSKKRLKHVCQRKGSNSGNVLV